MNNSMSVPDDDRTGITVYPDQTAPLFKSGSALFYQACLFKV